MPNKQEPMDLYAEIQPLVQRDIERTTNTMLQNKQYSTADVQIHTHDGIGSARFPIENLSNAIQHTATQRTILSATQVKALNTTPVVVVSQQSPQLTATQAKSFIVVLGVSAYIDYKGTAYTGANALEFRYTNGSGTKVTADIPNTFINSAASAFSYSPAVTTNFTPVSNAPIVVSVPVANPGTGDSPITFVVHYKVVSFQ